MEKYIGWAFFIVSIGLTVYGVNALLLALIYIFKPANGKTGNCAAPAKSISWPEVTIQLPVYNEAPVVRRLIDSAARINYPLDRLTIQVLDDSTDDTTQRAAERVEYWQSRGRNIFLIHRPVRSEYKAGALKHGMEMEHSEYLAVFDADFVIPADWLRQALPPFFEPGGETVGLVQTRWVHLNESKSALTRTQALLLDGHFGIEQRVRSDEGLFFNFNGTAGIWRRRCIEESGGWLGDTLSEDLDLSYRAQLRGWKFRYLPRVTAPAELPTTMSAFKTQQYRWAKGSMQALRRQLPRIFRAPVSIGKKLHGLLHISGFIVHLLMVLTVLLSLPLALAGPQALKDIPAAWLGVGALGAPLLFIAAEWSLYPEQSWWKRALWLPLMILMATGVAVSNSKAVISGLLNIHSPFQRTPKHGDLPAGKLPSHAAGESVRVDTITWLEIAFAVYALTVVAIDVRYANWFGAAYLSVYAAGFSWMALSTFWESGSPRLARQSPSNIYSARTQ